MPRLRIWVGPTAGWVLRHWDLGLALLQHHLADKLGCLIYSGRMHLLNIHAERVHLSRQVDSLH